MDGGGNDRENDPQRAKTKKPPRQKRSPIETAIRAWHENHAAELNKQQQQQQQHKQEHEVSDLTAQAPKRWTAYGSLVLLPSGSFTSDAWRDILGLSSNASEAGNATNSHDGDDEHSKNSTLGILWRAILDEISKATGSKLTHLAVNEGIPLHSRDDAPDPREGEGIGVSENILRSPSGLRILYGDFGPSTLSSSSSSSSSKTRSSAREESTAATTTTPPPTTTITEEDFARAFWVSTKQNGITQTWAPRWTMFSRGNIKEKARVLAFHDSAPVVSETLNNGSPSPFPSSSSSSSSFFPHRHIPSNQRANAIAVDLYAGIGYFAFSYAKLGFRVLGWELNPWSAEGLRRGAAANGWAVRVLRPASPSLSSSSDDEAEAGGISGGGEGEGEGEEQEQKEEKMLREVLFSGNERITIFLEDNTRAAGRLRTLDLLSRECEDTGSEKEKDTDTVKKGGDIPRPRQSPTPAPTQLKLKLPNIMHVNCGLLPSSQGSWATAWEITSESRLAWLHIHENVGVADIDAKKSEIRKWFEARAEGLLRETGVRTELCVEHVELVKTFAPGVWHCVFDLCVKRDVDGMDNNNIT